MKIKLLKTEMLTTFDCQTLTQLRELMKGFEYTQWRKIDRMVKDRECREDQVIVIE